MRAALLNEGDATHVLLFPVSLNMAADRTVEFEYTTTSLSAQADEDFTTVTGTAVIEKGSSQAVIEIPILGDTDEEQAEQFWISYSNGENVNIPEPFNTVTLLNDDISTNDSGYTTPLSYPGYTLVWNDEFDGTSLDQSSWNYETGAGGWGNNESQYYRSGTNNAEVANGKLTITAKEEAYSGAPYTSARITTMGKREFQYGRIDIRAKLPYGQGIWPALWMLGANFPTTGWPSCGETDIMELLGHEPNKMYSTAHWGVQGQNSIYSTGSYTLASGDFSQAFHVFTLKWEEDLLQFFVDDNLVHTITKSNVGTATYRHNAPFFFIFNIAVGGTWPGYPDQTTVFPQRMTVDYIRVFQ